MKFDAVFLDTTSNKYYDRTTLEKEPLGGTEATVVRVAEGLGELGLKVAVIQTRCPVFEPTMGQHAFFFHGGALPPSLTTENFIQIRSIAHAGLFPEAKQFIWMHDLSKDFMVDWVPTLIKHKIKLIGVSRWHKKDILKHLKTYEEVSYIYNPVPDEAYLPQELRGGYDKNLLVWLSSPHKGLGKCVELFAKMRKERPNLKLIVFNPGYLGVDTIKLSETVNAYYSGPMACKPMWRVVQKALCVFYPCQFTETFGMIASEANALGTPVATYARGGLKESVSTNTQLVALDDEQALMDLVFRWQDDSRPIVHGQDRFSMKAVLTEWLKLFDKS